MRLPSAPPERPAINPFVEPSHALAKQACWSIALVMILACLFSTLDNVVTLSNAHGTIAVQAWPRLFLAASGLAAGVIFDLAERRYMGLVMLGIAVLSTISILAVEAGADPNLGLVVFYLSSAFSSRSLPPPLHSWHRACMRPPFGLAWAAPPTMYALSPHRASHLLS